MKDEQQVEISKAAIYFIIGCVVYFLIYWHRLLLQSMMPFDGNMIRLFYPSWVVGKKLLLEGFYILWDPYRNMGQPFLADPQHQVFYPIRFLSAFLNFLDYQRIFVVSHALLAAVPAYVLGKRLFKDDLCALFIALVTGFSGFFLARATVPTHFATMTWVPALMLLLHTRRTVFLGVALSLQWMAGFPPFFILTFIILLIFSFVLDDWKSSLALMAKSYVIMLGLAAVQWIPFLEMLKESSRPVFLSGGQAIEYSVHPLEILRQTVVPSFVLTSLKSITDSDQAMIGFYFGPVFLALVSVGVLWGKRRERIFLAMGCLGLIMALGSYNGFYRFVPFITVFRFPAHWILLAIIGFAFVGANGLAHLRSQTFRRTMFGLVALDFLIYALPMHTAWGDLQFFSQAPLRLERLEHIPDESRVFHSSLITDQVHRWKIHSKEDWLVMKGSLIPSIGAAYEVKEAAGYNVLTSKRHLAFLNRLNHSPISSALFDYAGISKIISLTKEGTMKPIPEWKDLGVIENSDFKAVAFMESGNFVDVAKKEPGRIVVRAEGPGELVLSETYYPGWHVTVDGHKEQLGIFENEFPSVYLPPGTHQVCFYYRPRSFVGGIIVSMVSVLSIFTWALYTYRKGRRRMPYYHENF